jgi:hypothetical protein
LYQEKSGNPGGESSLSATPIVDRKQCDQIWWRLLSLGSFFIFTEVAQNPGANLTIASYNASAVKLCYTSSSLVRFENKNIFF